MTLEELLALPPEEMAKLQHEEDTDRLTTAVKTLLIPGFHNVLAQLGATLQMHPTVLAINLASCMGSMVGAGCIQDKKIQSGLIAILHCLIKADAKRFNDTMSKLGL